MPKNIVFCADGTWNGDSNDPADITDPTNVLKLFHNLDGKDTIDTLGLSDEQERVLKDGQSTVQVSKYLHGVGDSDNWLVKLIGGTVGAGLVARVIRGYTFISRSYQAGDRIYLVGFSRGAYTARSLAGLISNRGLLDSTKMDPTDKDAAYRAGAAQWTAYRRAALANKDDAGSQLEKLLDDLPHFFSTPPQQSPLIANVPVEAVAVWDTVGSLGIPVFDSHGANIDALRFADDVLSKAVNFGIHAIAIDEQRGNFTPCLWKAEARVTQCLFPGAHADVGGGYPMTGGESGLSDGALAWMIDQLRTRGVIFSDPLTYVPAPKHDAPAHSPWMHVPWTAFPKTVRTSVGNGPAGQFPAGLLVHESVGKRRQAGVVVFDGKTSGVYAPGNLGAYPAQ